MKKGCGPVIPLLASGRASGYTKILQDQWQLANRRSPCKTAIKVVVSVCLIVAGSELSTLRKENLKSMLVSVIILVLAVAAYLTFGSQ